jgi:alkaline phosphatase
VEASGRLGLSVVVITLLAGCASGGLFGGSASPAHARNVVLFLGDGMGVSTVTAARILEGQERGEPGEENWLSFERLPHLALVKTYNTDQQVPDSAGTMTAIMTGRKTRAGVLAIAPSVERGDPVAARAAELPTLLEQAEARGLATGIVTTARLTHATPAACYAHSPERDWEGDADLPPEAKRVDFPDIARQLVEFSAGDGPEVAMGGGRARFLPAGEPDPEDPALRGSRLDGRDLTREWREGRPGAAYVWNRDQLAALDLSRVDHLLGLFDPSHMKFERDRAADQAGEPSLSEMTAAAIEILQRNPKGFFLMVEGGRIDHAHHAGDAYRALTETIEFARAVRTALERLDPAETLVVVTADHSHTLTIGGYPKRGNPILGLVRGGYEAGDGGDAPARDALGLPYTTLSYANGPGYTGASSTQPEGPKHFPHFAPDAKGIRAGRPDLSRVATQDPDYLQEATVPLPAETHGGEDVAVYAGGPGSERVDGVQEQNFLYDVMAGALGWPQAGEAGAH